MFDKFVFLYYILSINFKLRGINMNALTVAIKTGQVEVLPDSERYKCRFTIRSESSNAKYMVSYDDAPGAKHWTCSCRGNMAHGQCKHLTAMGLKGRKYGKVLFEDPRKKQVA